MKRYPFGNNLAFTSYVAHQQELDDIANRIVSSDFTTDEEIEISDYLSPDDIYYIEQRVSKLTGNDFDLTL